MRVLVIGPRFGSMRHDSFPWFEATAHALKRLGHSVTSFAYNAVWLDRVTRSSAGRRLAQGPSVARWSAQCRAAWLSYRDHRLLRLSRQLRPELILILKGETLSVELLRALRRTTEGCLATWWLDDPWRHSNCVEQVGLFDHVFIFDRSYLPRLRAAGAPAAHFLPCACDETIYRPLSLTSDEQRRFKCQISFVASYYPCRAAVVRALAEDAAVDIWGWGWRSMEARDALHGAAVVRGRQVDKLTAAKIYNASSIGLNVHHEQSRLGGLNMRAFELLAAGTFELVDVVAGMEELLVPGEEVIVYRSFEEARALARYYLRHPEERRRIAARGRARVLREHTYVKRMETLLQGASR